MSAIAELWQKVRDRTHYPKLNFFVDFLQDLGLVAGLNAGAHVFVSFSLWLDKALPLGQTSGPESYLPVDHIRVILTVLYAISMLSIAVSGGCTLIKVAIGQFRSLRG